MRERPRFELRKGGLPEALKTCHMPRAKAYQQENSGPRTEAPRVASRSNVLETPSTLVDRYYGSE